MTEKTDSFDDEPMMQSEPDSDSDGSEMPENLWMRGLYMLILAVLFGVAETLLVVSALVQFGWMVFAKQKNAFIAEFGADMGRWMSDVAAFQTGQTEDKPFPWDSLRK